jgi:DNA-binding NarL/FixJ family response regulator
MHQLSLRERELLRLMAAGYSNAGIASELYLAPKTVEAHVRSIFRKLNLPQGDQAHRRVCAVLLYLRASGALQPARPRLARVA